MDIKKILGSSIIGPLIAFIMITIIISLTTDRFLQTENLRNISLQVSIVSLMAIGSTMVIISGGIDLSPGSAVTFLTMVLASLIKFLKFPAPLAIILVIILGGILGLYNGVLCAYLRIPAFITTLASLGIFRGMAFMINKGSPIFQVSKVVQSLFYGTFLGLPLVFFYITIFYVAASIMMKYTELGREIYAVGGNAAAARFSGINVKRVTMIAFGLAGMMAGVSSVLMTARLNSGSPNYGVGMELSAIAAAVIGGASLAGGHGNILSTLIGALTIVIVQNALNLHAVPTSVQNIVVGVIIMLAVFIDMWRVEIGGLVSRIVPTKG